jgi:iron(III) transport system ATP-binding protein
MGVNCSISSLVKDYGAKRVVDDVSLDIKAGEFLVILGPSGCGKTTTLRMVAGLEMPDAGTIEIAGKVVSDPARDVFIRPEHRDLGMVFQSYAIWPHMSVAENVAFPLRARTRMPKEDIRRKVADVLQLVGLEGLGNRPSSALSGGQMQRVVLARAIVYDPGILLFDEPLSNLDLKMREHLRVELKALQARTGLTSVYVTHDQTEAVELADRIAVMSNGRVVQLGAPADIYRRPATRFVAEFISSANIFTARVDSLAGPHMARVTTAQGRNILAGFERSVAVGEAVDVVIHPEECRIEPGVPQSDDEAAVRMTHSRFQGVSVRYTVDWGSEPFDVVALGTGPLLAPGDAARLIVTPGAARILPGSDAP